MASQGEWVVFHCEVSSQFQEWQVNGQLTSQLGSGYISTDDDFHDGVHTISLSGLRNEDSVECVCRHLIQSGEWEVCNSSASVTLQGTCIYTHAVLHILSMQCTLLYCTYACTLHVYCKPRNINVPFILTNWLKSLKCYSR